MEGAWKLIILEGLEETKQLLGQQLNIMNYTMRKDIATATLDQKSITLFGAHGIHLFCLLERIKSLLNTLVILSRREGRLMLKCAGFTPLTPMYSKRDTFWNICS